MPNEIKSLRALMAKYGDEKKPIVITEHGWPTHDARVKDLHVLLAGLKIADPQKQSWRAVYAATSRDDGKVAEALAEGLPPGSTAETCFGARLKERLAAGDVSRAGYHIGIPPRTASVPPLSTKAATSSNVSLGKLSSKG